MVAKRVSHISEEVLYNRIVARRENGLHRNLKLTGSNDQWVTANDYFWYVKK